MRPWRVRGRFVEASLPWRGGLFGGVGVDVDEGVDDVEIGGEEGVLDAFGEVVGLAEGEVGIDDDVKRGLEVGADAAGAEVVDAEDAGDGGGDG